MSPDGRGNVQATPLYITSLRLQYTGQPTILLNPGFVYEMPNTSYSPLSPHSDFEGPPSAPEKKTSPPPVSSSFRDWALRHPLLSSIVVSMIIVGIIASAMNLSYIQDN